MSVVGNQQQVFLGLLRQLRPHWHSDAALPARIQRLLAADRRFGSRDRRLYRELIYTALRYLPWIEPDLDQEAARAVKTVAWLAAETRDTRQFRTETAGDWTGLPSLAARAEFLGHSASDLLPGWFREHCPEVFAPAELEVQLARAPLWIRLQTEDPTPVTREFATQGWRTQASGEIPSAWKVLAEADLTKSTAYQRGQIEIQDLGSQMVLESLGIAQGERWLDACAGAGGKTLQLSQRVGAGGQVDAHDIRTEALDELLARAERAGAENIRIASQPAASAYAGVLVDAPCSGSGTWRRSPHLKWTTTPATITERTALQLNLLRRFSTCVQPGGRLVYATCSLSQHENAAVVRTFLAEQKAFIAEAPNRSFGFTPQDHGLTVLPSHHDTDGFFVASLRRR